jgi:hypothetical protein
MKLAPNVCWEWAMTMFLILGLVLAVLMIAPLFGTERPVARY